MPAQHPPDELVAWHRVLVAQSSTSTTILLPALARFDGVELSNAVVSQPIPARLSTFIDPVRRPAPQKRIDQKSSNPPA
jgi:hypothetical protein